MPDSATPSKPRRPLSPHLQVYRPQLTSVLSIVHRATGIIMSIGALLLVWWLWAASAGAGEYAIARGFFASLLGESLLFTWVWCTFYHLCNGIRHLVWDVGYGLELHTAYLTGRIVVVASLVLTLAAWLI